MAHPVDLLVDLAFLLDEGVGARHIGLGLVVVVIRYEILDGVLREEALELAVKLCRQGLVRREDDRRALGRLDDLGRGEGLAGAGGAEQHLVALAGCESRDQFGDRGGLVAGGLELRAQHEGPAALELGAAGIGQGDGERVDEGHGGPLLVAAAKMGGRVREGKPPGRHDGAWSATPSAVFRAMA